MSQKREIIIACIQVNEGIEGQEYADMAAKGAYQLPLTYIPSWNTKNITKHMKNHLFVRIESLVVTCSESKGSFYSFFCSVFCIEFLI